MSKTTAFKFADPGSVVRETDFVGILPANVADESALLEAVGKSLNFPDYYGKNWDAFWDCVCDLSWINQRTVVLVHEDIPAVPHPVLLKYLSILADAIKDWGGSEPHELVVLFPVDTEARITSLLNADSRD